MDSETRHDRLIGSLYEAALQPAGWHGALHALAQQVQADNFHLFGLARDETTPRFSLTWGMDAQVEAEYRAHYGAIDPRRLLVAALPAGHWLACHHHFDQRAVERSGFFQDYLIHGGIRYLLGSRLQQVYGIDLYFGVHRAPGRQPFGAAPLALVRRITPHFQRATRLWLQTEALREQALIGQQALDAVELGVAALDAQGRLLFANRCAEALLREGDPLRLHHGVLTSTPHDAGRRLPAAIAAAAATRRARHVTLQAPGQALADACVVTVMALPPDGLLSRRFSPASLLVLVNRGQRRRTVTALQLMQLFAVSPAEARLARALAAGETLEAYAAANDVAITTVRSQLRAVFDKTGTRRQPELARLLAIIPAVREPGRH